MGPFDCGFNAAITHIANLIFPCGFDVSFDAPQTYEELKAHLDAGNRMAVWKGGSDNTIYACPEVNWCFRAWHDWCHWRGQFPFTLEGEKAAYHMQASHIIALYDDWELQCQE